MAKVKPLGRTRWLVRWLMILPLIVTLACLTPVAATPAPTSVAAPTTGATPESPTPQASGSATPSEAVDSTPEGTAISSEFDYGPGTFVITDTRTGLATLASYTASLSQIFEGTQAGQAVKTDKTTVMLAASQPAARQVTIQRAGEGAVVLAELNGARYEKHGENACTATAVVPGEVLADQYEPAALLDSVVGADEAGAEAVNGVPTHHYTFAERALGREGFSKSTGELWIADEGGYIVKYVLTTQAGAEFFGPDVEGKMTWDYELTGVNQPVTVEPPQDCPAGFIDVPLLPDAANVRSLPGVLSYDSATGAVEAGTFYQEKLPALGWELSNTFLITDTGSLLDFSQGTGSLTVMITPGRDHSAIRIVQTR